MYKQKPQIAGEAAHKSIGDKSYSSRKNVLQDVEVFSEKYNICGKIDVFDCASGKLTEKEGARLKQYMMVMFFRYMHSATH